MLGDLGLWGNEADARPGWITERDVLARALAGAGFTDVRVIADDHTVRYPDLDHYWESQRRHQGASGRRAASLDAAQSERVRAALAKRFGVSEHSDCGIDVVATALLAVASR